MTHFTAVRRIQFCAGHRVHKHESKCAHIHGHNYVAYFHAHGDGLDKIGRVIDFSVLKEKIGGWVDTYWDHGFIYYEKDYELAKLFIKYSIQVNNETAVNYDAVLNNHKSFALPYNPTAENMAQYLCEVVCPEVLAGAGVEVFKVVLWETENCYAEYYLR